MRDAIRTIWADGLGDEKKQTYFQLTLHWVTHSIGKCAKS
ncbi:hypothetical protein LEWO105114_01760 [Legionella worsleiensis]|nr:Uncharacterised protein [Legionella worsleiensis]